MSCLVAGVSAGDAIWEYGCGLLNSCNLRRNWFIYKIRTSVRNGAAWGCIIPENEADGTKNAIKQTHILNTPVTLRPRVVRAPATGSKGKKPRPEKPDTRFDRRLSEVLQHATTVFYEKGYEGASMRDLSRESGMSLAGLYYYFENKEKLLHMIQRHTFQTVMDRLKERLVGVSDPEERMRIFIANHLEYFLQNMKAMKVLSHEADVLGNEYGQEIAGIKREYYRICLRTLQELKREWGVESTAPNSSEEKSPRGAKASIEDRTQVLSLFGMMNWIYTWHNSRTDADAAELSRTMSDLFLQGVLGRKNSGQRSSRTKS